MHIYVNEKWCTNISVKERECSPDLELLTVGLRPFYLPREFNQIFVTVVYIPPHANTVTAATKIADIHNELERKSPDSVKLILGDFNNCELDGHMPQFSQYVQLPTRGERVLDKCYGNVKEGYKARIRPSLGASDHNTVHLIPKCRQKLKKSKPAVKTVRRWTDDAVETLPACLRYI